MEFGEAVRITRRKQNITQQQLAEDCWMAHSTIQKMEKFNKFPTLYNAEKIAEALGVKLSDLIRKAEDLERSKNER